ncbi:MAG: hypothetical protein F6K26_39175 [Moorea sp. SIO2I5]|nr:hypothetical protein [Moorena sp. SIO2I5]
MGNTANFAPLAPQLWGEIELKSPRIGGFRGLAALGSEVNSSENGCKLITDVGWAVNQKDSPSQSALLDTAHQQIKTEEKQETNQIKEILTGQLFPPPCTSG